MRRCPSGGRRKPRLSESPGTLTLTSVSNGIETRSWNTLSLPLKKAFLIITVVVAYSLVEMALLLSTFASHQGYFYPSTYQAVVWLGQLLLIPGLAAVFSRIMYGPFGSGRRTMTILLAGSLGVPIAMIAVLIPVALLAWAYDVSPLLFDGLLPVILTVMVTALFVAVRRSGGRGVQAEASRWLVERRSGMDPREIKWRKRGINFASWIPASMVLLLFLFLPEVWGMLSHLDIPQSGRLSGYYVPIPETWIVLRHENQGANGWSIASGLAGRGIWRGGLPYLRGPLPFSSWSIGTRSGDEDAASMSSQSRPKDDEIIRQRVVTIGSDNISCVEYTATYVYNPWGEIFVDCSDAGRFFANFAGPKTQIEKFYEVLGGIAEEN